MRFTRLQPSEFYTFFFLLPAFSSALDCEQIRTEGTRFNLKPLAGPHSLFVTTEHYPRTVYTNYTLDVCQPLKKAKSKDPKEGSQCKSGTYVCAYQTEDNSDEPWGIISIAGQHLADPAGDVKYTRLKTERKATPDRVEGVRIEMSGNKYNGRKQEAIFEMRCKDSDKPEEKLRSRADEDDKDGGNQDDDGGNGDGEKKEKSDPVDDGKGGTIRYVSYGPLESNGAVDVLFVQWDTKYACEDREPDEESKKGWGFFTWLFVIVFLAAAAYLIFGSWLNYNRYGARGWDLLPHGDTIRDVPYILQDWGRKVVDTVQGGGSRGGYSAV